ncbi:histidinol-phosphate aminotransferase 1 [Siminovitchia terrae]|uniref:Histidinol-phosphate aminotransferase n=1 Tax=Siminovitchia terrae TaxID=1914933 RepID=A0A429X4T2_SIMTE|nr:histidinol-phosphate transaminase [Siminovitchia terrae]RST58293.1 histidinol-phosphate transaminase [Siminovitchia terrae]GIN91989.1 histidinol-phosphate aminotransferase 1 [Siminovitchia terrae]GIN96574.1 histidinol-phosphate aminotransferase 1 [Siminovitchia terrae]
MNVKVRPQLLSLKAYTPGKSSEEVQREYKLEKIVKLASNENPYGTSPFVKEAISKIDNFAIYPDGASTALRKEVAEYTGVKEDQLIFSSGLDELIQIISKALLDENFNTVMASGTFPQYRHNAVVQNAEIREVPLKNGCHDLPEMAKQIDDNTQVVWICNPNNPTGTYVDNKELEQFLQSIPSHVLVVMDEAYYEYVTVEDYPETIPLLDQYDNLMVLRTFSKAFGLASFRIGYGIGAASFIQQLEVVRLPFNTSVLAQKAALAALKDLDFVKQSVSLNAIELQKYYEFCKQHQIDFYTSQGNFIFISIPGKESAEVFQYLLERGYTVRPFPNGVRITVGTKEENEELFELIEKIVLIAH